MINKQKSRVKLIISSSIVLVLTIVSAILTFRFIITNLASNISSESSFTSDIVQVRDFLQPYILASIDGSELKVIISKEQVDLLNENNTYPFTWGIHLTSKIGERKPNDYIIELELCIYSTGEISEVGSSVYLMNDSNVMELISSNIIEVDAEYDENDYIVLCNIENDYIPVDDICINTVFYR